VISLLEFKQFDPTRRATWLWLILYIGSALITGFLLWKNRRLPLAQTKTSGGWQKYLLGQGIVGGIYGLALLLFPRPIASSWPWPIDDFHARIYSSIFIAGAAGVITLAISAGRYEFLTMGLSQVAFGAGAIIGVLVVDASAHRVNWSLPGTWLWMAFFAILTVAGMAMIWKAQWMRRF
jgi:hypothetical protein